MSVRLSDPKSNFSASSIEVTRPVATFHQLQRFLQQSLRDLHAESSDLESSQEQELSQSLQRLTGRLHHILAELTDLDRADSESVSVLGDVSVPRGPIHLMTSPDGVVLMANDAAVEALKMNVANIGRVELAEWIPYEEWRLIRQQLRALDPPRGSVSWIVNMTVPGTDSQRMMCSVVPMLDQSRNVTAWHWELHRHQESSRSHPFNTLIQDFETDFLRGESLDCCLTRICEGLVQTFDFPFVWIATVRNGQRVHLRAHASMPTLDWDAHGLSWWASISRQDELMQACAEVEGSLVSQDAPYTGEFSWFPTAFQLQEAYCVSLSRGEISGLLVVCSKIPKVFDVVAQRSLEALGHQIENLLVRGMEIEQFRLDSAVLNAVHDPVCVTDSRGRIEWMNQAFFRTLGGANGQVVGAPLRSFPHAQFQEARPTFEATAKTVGFVKTEIMEKGSNEESLVFDQMVTPLVDAEGFTTHFVVSLHDVTVRAVAEIQMKHQAYHDSLTGLPNRIMFEDHLRLGLAQARRDGTLLALLFLDLDNFKPINDQHGHDVGDCVLRAVAERLASCVRTTDTVSRLSGDEFTIVLQGLERIQDIRQVAKKILDCLTPPIPLDGQSLPVKISIGIAVSPHDSTDPRNLLAMADQAMYRAKDFGGQRWYFSTAEWNID